MVRVPEIACPAGPERRWAKARSTACLNYSVRLAQSVIALPAYRAIKPPTARLGPYGIRVRRAPRPRARSAPMPTTPPMSIPRYRPSSRSCMPSTMPRSAENFRSPLPRSRRWTSLWRARQMAYPSTRSTTTATSSHSGRVLQVTICFWNSRAFSKDR